MSTTTLREDEQSDIEDRLWNVVEKTRTDGSLDAEVTGIVESGKSKLKVKYELPNGKKRHDFYQFPETADSNTKLARLARENGYSLEHVMNLVGDTITVVNTGNGWKPKLAPVERNRREEVKEKLGGMKFVDTVDRFADNTVVKSFGALTACVGIFLLMPLFTPLITYYMYKREMQSRVPIPFTAAGGTFAICVAASMISMLIFGLIDAGTAQFFWHFNNYQGEEYLELNSGLLP